jgi:hypothetical protein
LNPLVKDAIDLHVHTAPDVMPRKLDDLELAQRIIAAGMKGYAAKSHNFCTGERAQIIRKIYPQCNMIGSITLNSSVGGINPMAVEMAARVQTKIVWFPTLDSKNEIEKLNRYPSGKLPYWAQLKMQMETEGIVSPSICILTNGKLKEEVFNILDVIARFNMILATGHLSQKETFALVKAAKDRKVKRIIITHVDFPSTFYSIEEQKDFIKQGAFVEHCYITPAYGQVAWEVVIEQIRAIGPDRIVLTTDLGQATGIFPDEGMAVFAEKMLANGFSEKDIRKMIVANPASLIE